MTQHTPGPWQIEKDGVSSTNAPDDGDIICDAPIYAEHSMKRWEANARLIAAAPDLLAALQAIVMAWDSPKERAALSYAHLETAKNAIARAEGRL